MVVITENEENIIMSKMTQMQPGEKAIVLNLTAGKPHGGPLGISHPQSGNSAEK